MKPSDRKLAQRLVQMGALPPSMLEQVIARHETSGATSLADTLVASGLVPSRDVIRASAELAGFRFIELSTTMPDPEALALVPADLATRAQVLPLAVDATVLTVAMADPTNVYVCDDLRRKTRRTIETLQADPAELRDAIRAAYTPQTRETTVRESTASQEPTRIETPPERGEASSRRQRIAVPLDQRETVEIEVATETPGTEPGVTRRESDTATATRVGFTEADPSALETLEKQRLTSGVYQVSPSPAVDDSSVSPANALIMKAIDEALQGGAEQIEFVPDGALVRVRAHFANGVHDFEPIAAKHHESIVRRTRFLAGLATASRTEPLERHFSLKTRRGETPCVGFFEPTRLGERVILRFTGRVPLLADPLRDVGLPERERSHLDGLLQADGSGLLFITTTTVRTASRLFASLLHRYGTNGREVLSLERTPERPMPFATQVIVPTVDLLLAGLTNASFMNPSLLAVASVENGTVMNSLITTAMRGITSVGFFQARDAATGLACFRAARVEPMNLLRGVCGYLHVEDLRLLCPACRQELPKDMSIDLPEWAKGVATQHYEAPGCDKCLNTGRVHALWATALYVPDNDAADGTFRKLSSREEALKPLLADGRLDPRELTA